MTQLKLTLLFHILLESRIQLHPKLYHLLLDIKVKNKQYLASVNMQFLYIIVFNAVGLEGTTSFSLTHDIKTNVSMVTSRVLLVDRNLPYHINLYSNVIIFGSATITTTTYSYIPVTTSYTSLANADMYKSFSPNPSNSSDYSHNKIVAFLSCF